MPLSISSSVARFSTALPKTISKNTIRALALALAVSSLPMISPTPAHAQAISQQSALNAFDRSRYGYCDAKKVAAVWGRDTFSAKAVIGTKILSGLTHLIDQDIASTAGRVFCSFEESGFTYNDAVRLSSMWNIGVIQAKDKIQYNASQMGTKRFRDYAGL